MNRNPQRFLPAIIFLCLSLFTACTAAPIPTSIPATVVDTVETIDATPIPTPSPVPPRVLTICMGREPTSLFLYGDASVAARSVREAIYDGPFDWLGFEAKPVILEKVPSLSDGDVLLEPVSLESGSLIVDAEGNLTNLKDGILYLPSGCSDASCAATFSGQESVSLDQLVVRFQLRPNLQWSDGAPLTADDSVYSFQVAESLFPRVKADLIAHTQSYLALDEVTVEWRGIPGYRNSNYPTLFFTPLPRHLWGAINPEELLSAEIASRYPIGWGPYQIEEWVPGDHISLVKNPVYFRAGEGKPSFDNLVFRFVEHRESALEALLAGECDYIDETVGLETQSAELMELEKSGQVAAAFETGTAWEHANFGITAADTSQPALFQLKETRQAIAMCIDRQRMAEELFFGQSLVPDTYVPPTHPLVNPDVQQYEFDPQAAAVLLESVGWLDTDHDPATPRTAQGVPGVPNGTPLEFVYQTTPEEEKQHAAEILQASLAQCGIRANISTSSWEDLLAPGPEGPVFGRSFQMAQFGWITAQEHPCFLYTSQEIPGVYPEFPKGWGGANVSGYSNPSFDHACQRARSAFPGTDEYLAAHHKAQALFAEELPAVPLYLRLKLVAMRPDLCGVITDPSAESALWNIEHFDYGLGCGQAK